MPKKGKGKKKGGKGKGEKKGAEPPPPVKVEEEKLTELSKQFYLIQIKDLEERLARYQAKCDQLQLANDEFLKQLKQQKEDQEQMITFLKKKGQDQAEQYMDLEEKLIALRQAKDAEREKFEQQIAQLKEDSQRALDQAAVENKVLQGQLESLENFRLNKERLEVEMRQKDELIEQQQKEHSEALYRLEKKAVLDKDRMKKEMVAKVNSVAAEFRKVSDLQMAETTKRTIRENVTINQQMSKMSGNTMDLLRENEVLRAKERELRRQLEVLEVNEREMSRRNVSNQKVMLMLKEKAVEQDQQLSDLQQTAMLCDQLKEEARQASKHAATCSKETEFCRQQVSSLEEELVSLRRQLGEARRELQRLRTVVSRASQTIQTSLRPVASEAENLIQRDSLLATLLELLSLTAAEERTTKDCTASQSGSNPPTLQFQYQPGDLGIVPRRPVKGSLVQRPTGSTMRTHPSEFRSGGAGPQLPPLAGPASPLTGNTVR